MSGWLAAAQAAGDLIGGWLNREEAEDERFAQKEFAQHGIQWRVQDAKAAGLHPLAALGAAGASYSPVISGIGDNVASAIGHAAEGIFPRKSESSGPEQAGWPEEYQDPAIKRYNEARAKLAELDVIEAQRRLAEGALARQPGNGVPLKLEDSRGTKDTGAIKLSPAPQVSRNPNEPHQIAGSDPFWKQVETAPGVFRSIPNPDLNVESDLVGALVAAQGYVDRLVSQLMGGAPKYIQEKTRSHPRYYREKEYWTPDYTRSYHRYGVERKGR